jgi:hypothetical protein
MTSWFNVELVLVCYLVCLAEADQWSTTDMQNIIASGGSDLTGISELSKQLLTTPISITKNVNSNIIISDSTNLQVGLSSFTTNYDNNGHEYTKGVNFVQTFNLPTKSTILINQNFVLNWDKSKIDASKEQLNSLVVFPEIEKGPKALGFNSEQPEEFYKELMQELGGFYGSGFDAGAYMSWIDSESSNGITCEWGHTISVEGQG